MATLGLRLAQVGKTKGGGLCVGLRAIHSIGPAKKREHAVVRADWSHKGQRTLTDFVVVGDWKKLRARWKALLGAQGDGS